MKKLYLLVAFYFFFSAVAFSQTPATATIPDTKANPNTDVSIPINVTNFNNVGAINLIINYDPNVLTFQTVKDSLDGFWILNSLTGQIRIGWFNLTPLNVSNGPLFHLNFKYKGGNSNIEFDPTGNQIADANAVVIPTTFTNGSIAPLGVTPTSSIGNFVWDDTNKDGIQDANELGIKDVVVKLLDAANSDAVLKTTTTDTQGNYNFGNLTAGSYKVSFTLPTDFNFSPKNASTGTNDNNSDVNSATGKTDVLTLNAGDNLTNVDAGMFYNPPPPVYASVGDFVWDDTNKDGIQDANELGIKDVVVKLLDAANSDAVLKTTTTDTQGNYNFGNLTAGNYKVSFTLPTDFNFSPKNASTSTNSTDSDVNPSTSKTDAFTLNAGDNLTNVDAGMYYTSTTVTINSLEGDVWIDANKDGVKNDPVVGLQDVTVDLYTKDAQNKDKWLAFALTDANGHFKFDSLALGDYYTQFSLVDGNKTYSFTTPHVGNDNTKDSDADILTDSTAKTPFKTINSGSNTNSWDAGVFKNTVVPPVYASVGDFVWDDTNKDGIQDNNETGIKDVVVKLLDAANSDAVLKTTTTDTQGNYNFGNLTAGSYKVLFTLPTNYNFSPKNTSTGTNDNNSDVNPATGKTDAFTLNAGDNLTNVDAGMYDSPVVVQTPKPWVNIDDYKTVSPDSGLTTTYTITFANNGDADLSNATIIDTIPNGYSYVSSSGGISSAETSNGSNIVIFQIGTVTVNNTDSVKLTVRVTNLESNYLTTANLLGNDNNSNKYQAYAGDLNLGDVTSGGEDAGVESKGDLANLLLKRQLLIRYGRTTPLLAKTGVNAITSQHSLSEFYPTVGPYNSSATVTTPFDILGISNAVSSYAVDYNMTTSTGLRRVAGIFSTITNAPYIYDHTKGVCDRLGGAMIGDLRLLNINGYQFYAAKMRNEKKNQTDYAISFSVYESPSGYKLQSKWTYGEYVSPNGASSIYNFQVWSSTYDGTVELVKSILSKLSSFGTLTYLNVNQVEPDVYIQSSYYSHDGTIHLKVMNLGKASQISLDYKYRISQGDVQNETPGNFTVQNGENDIVLSPGIISDANISLTSSTGFKDEVFVSGGSYTDISGPNSTVSSFSTVNYPQPIPSNYADGTLLLSGGVSISGNLSDWVSVIRSFYASGDNIDLSNYSNIKFKAKGTGVLTLIFDLTNTQNYNYFSYSVNLTPVETEYSVSFSDLTELTPNQNQFNPGLVRDIGFALYKKNNPNLTNFNFDVSNIVFSKSLVTGIEDNNLVPKEFSLSQNYPNPFNPSTNIEFTVAKTESISLIVYNILGQQVKVLINREVNAGKHVVNFDASGLASGIYIYRLLGKSVNIIKKMILLR